MLLSSDTPVGIAKSIGLGVIGFADVFDRLKPDILVLLGDRYEVLAAAEAALVARIPIAHIHGGEATEGLIDEAIRHSVTKMSHLHFVAAEPYRQRVIQLGEQPDHVFTVGALGLDNIKKLTLLKREDFEKSIGFRLSSINFLVTYHPVTLDDQGPQKTMGELFQALDAYPEANIIITKPNADTNGRIICAMIDAYAAQWPDRVKASISLGQIIYLSALQYVDVVIGNSSSGLIEAPTFRKPTVNLGDRQKGRLRADSVLDCSENKKDIQAAIQKALSPDFRKMLDHVKSPYEYDNASQQIKNYLRDIVLHGLLKKTFYDGAGYK